MIGTESDGYYNISNNEIGEPSKIMGNGYNSNWKDNIEMGSPLLSEDETNTYHHGHVSPSAAPPDICSTSVTAQYSLPSEDLSWSHIMQIMNSDVHYRLENGRFDFDYSKIYNSELLTTLFRFKDYIEVLSMKNMRTLQTILDNITPENNNFNYKLALILINTRNAIIELMTKVY